jgi:hypothetical protein
MAIPGHGGNWYLLIVCGRHSCRDPQHLTPFVLARHHMGNFFFQGCTSDVHSDTSLTFSCSKNCLFVCWFVQSIPFTLTSSNEPYSQDIVNRNTVASAVVDCRLGSRSRGYRRVAPRPIAAGPLCSARHLQRRSTSCDMRDPY